MLRDVVEYPNPRRIGGHSPFIYLFTVFDDQAIVFFDPDHSDEEDRFILLGTSYKLNQLVVCHCFREEETKVRIISARKADKEEADAYWENRK